jgi:hypothetical protein
VIPASHWEAARKIDEVLRREWRHVPKTADDVVMADSGFSMLERFGPIEDYVRIEPHSDGVTVACVAGIKNFMHRALNVHAFGVPVKTEVR